MDISRLTNDFIRSGDIWEPVGHTPLPGFLDLRAWDRRLLDTYKPLHVNQDPASHARLCLDGLAAAAARARALLDWLAGTLGTDFKLNLGGAVSMEAPLTRTILGLKPETLGDLRDTAAYCESQLAVLNAALYSGCAEADYEAIANHAGTLTLAALEAEEVARLSGLGYPVSTAETPLSESGPGAVDRSKASVLVVGTSPLAGHALADYLRLNNLGGMIELAALGGAAQELARAYPATRVLGPAGWQGWALENGIGDVVLAEAGCIDAVLLRKARILIAASPEVSLGLPDFTDKSPDDITAAVSGGTRHILVANPAKAAVCAARLALARLAANTNPLPPVEGIGGTDKYVFRTGRGPVLDTEIRAAGAPLVQGVVPGVIALLGCAETPGAAADLAAMAAELAKRKYVVLTAGCAAISAAFARDAEGKNVYEQIQPGLGAGCLINLGGCAATSHIAGMAIKLISNFAKLPLRANYEVAADYTLNRIGVAAIAWGSTPRLTATAAGFVRMGAPVIVGPGAKAGRLLQGAADEKWTVTDGRTGLAADTGEPSPGALVSVVANRAEALVAAARACLRRNDTPQGRQVKLAHYISLHKQMAGGALPPDIALFVRKSSDIPIFNKKEVLARLQETGWAEKPVLTLPTWVGSYPSRVTLQEVVH
jgi:CO dehydrogenase/acetyl-CoA synthase alpha subunit